VLAEMGCEVFSIEIIEPVARQAQANLEATGLVERRPHKGVVVCSFDARHVADLFEAMRELESLCARLAAERMTDSERHRLSETHTAMAALVEANDVDAYESANHRFHTLIYQGSHNRCIEDMAQTTRMRVAPFRDLQFQLPDRLERSHREHTRVVQAILAAATEDAARHMAEHVGRVESASARYVRHRRTHRSGMPNPEQA